MKRTTWIAAIMICLGAVVLVDGLNRHNACAQTAGSGNAVWKYGRLVQIPAANSYSWDARPGVYFQANSLAELYKKLGGEELPDGGIVVFYNLLGTQGWEFAGQDAIAVKGNEARCVLFKRLTYKR